MRHVYFPTDSIISMQYLMENGASTAISVVGKALRSAGDLSGKIVLDITNPLTADYMGLTIGHDTSAAEQIAKAVPGAEVVKGFNTLFAQVLAAGSDFGGGQKVTVFVASDSDRAKQAARTLAESMGFKVMDAGGLKNARYLEPLAGLDCPAVSFASTSQGTNA